MKWRLFMQLVVSAITCSIMLPMLAYLHIGTVWFLGHDMGKWPYSCAKCYLMVEYFPRDSLHCKQSQCSYLVRVWFFNGLYLSLPWFAADAEAPPLDSSTNACLWAWAVHYLIWRLQQISEHLSCCLLVRISHTWLAPRTSRGNDAQHQSQVWSCKSSF